MAKPIDLKNAELLVKSIRDSFTHEPIEKITSYTETNRKKILLDLQEKQDILKMRYRWSNWLLGVIVAIVGIDFVIIFFVGFELINFHSDIFMPLFIGDSLIKTLGLAIIVVKFLFDDKQH